MALILNIDTSVDEALVSLAIDERPFHTVTNSKTYDHATWIQKAIQNVMEQGSRNFKGLDAVGVTIGPGSYTGLRIGLATAKGLCYALKIPMITVGTLEVLAFSAIKASASLENTGASAIDSAGSLLYCPMIDARRMEVFTAVYDLTLKEVLKPHALILRENSFQELLQEHKIFFLGNGSLKFHKICQNTRAMFKNVPLSPVALANLIYRNFIGNNFAGLAYTEPLYLKEFFTTENTDPVN